MNQQISENMLTEIPVKIDTVKKRVLEKKFTFAGILNPEKQLLILSQTQGEVEKLNVEIGDPVRQGEEIVKVDDDILKANLLVAEVNYEKAKKDLDRFEKMIKQDGITQDQLEKMRLNFTNAEANYITLTKKVEQTSIKAPFNGYINQIFTKEGAILGPGVPVVEVVNIRRFKATLNVSEAEIMEIKKGMEALIIPKVIDTIQLKGIVETRAMSANMAQQYAVEIIVDNPYPEILKGGMIAQIYLSSVNTDPVLTIHRSLIRGNTDENFVFRIQAGEARKTIIHTGIGNDNFIEIISGLSENDLVIARGFNGLTNGQKVKIVYE